MKLKDANLTIKACVLMQNTIFLINSSLPAMVNPCKTHAYPCKPMQNPCKTHAWDEKIVCSLWVLHRICTGFWRRIGSAWVLHGYVGVLHGFDHCWYRSID
ncbi:hypothetical protein Y032_0015g2559 [Ancylostoma ceylanicum]|uniref:Uncharacterized protein n=1 Tax=Ancylostoma ceylanicum TaxID=53326 RepID=A0A016V7K5_9BILA|nr:hypothetical protein Y032_0015g2559 [Ancylostoma ceylanicum]